MPIVDVRCLEGTTVEQKRKLAKEITDAVAKNFEVPQETVVIHFFDMTKDHAAKGGKLQIDRSTRF